MKTLIFTFLLTLTINLSAQWLLRNGGTSANLNKVFVIDSLRAYVVGEQSTILKTTDGGISWNKIIVPVIDNFRSVHFITQYHGIIVGSQTLIETTDGGNNWEEIHDSTQHENICGFVNGPYMMIGENNGKFKRTTNGGYNWTIARYLSNPILSLVFRKSSAIGFFSSTNAIYKTLNFGVDWSKTDKPALPGPNVPIWLKMSKDDSTLFATGSFGDYPIYPFVLLYNLAINNWMLKSYFQLEDKTFLDIAPLTSYNFYLCSRFGYLAKTIDGGDSLQVQAVPTNQNLNSIDFYNSEIGYAVGNSGTILVTHNGGATSVIDLDKVVSGFSLSQNYPNPFNPSTKISWQLPVSSWQTLKVYDVLGNEVATLVDEYKLAGSYEVEFNPVSGIGKLASGIYFYQLRVGEFVQTKKMILMR